MARDTHWYSDHLRQGDIFRDTGQLPEAEAAYRGALESEFAPAEAHGKLFDLYLQMGRLEEAVRELYCLPSEEVERLLGKLTPAGGGGEVTEDPSPTPPTVAWTSEGEQGTTGETRPAPADSTSPGEGPAALPDTLVTLQVGDTRRVVAGSDGGLSPFGNVTAAPSQTRQATPHRGQRGMSARQAAPEQVWRTWLVRAAGGVLLALSIYMLWGGLSAVPQRPERPTGLAPVMPGSGQVAQPGVPSMPLPSPAPPSEAERRRGETQPPAEEVRRSAQERQRPDAQRQHDERQSEAAAPRQTAPTRREDTPTPAPTALAAFMAQLEPGPYALIVASAAKAEDARREVAAIEAKYPELRPWMNQGLNGKSWAVSIGESYTRQSAEALRKKAIELGLRRDAFLWDTRRAR